MPDELLSYRVERLEKIVKELQTLPAHVVALGERVESVETQIVQFRAEMRAGFSAVRSEIHAGLTSVRTELREEMHQGFAAHDGMLIDLASVTTELGRHVREFAEESKRHTQTLFEEVIDRIAKLGETRTTTPDRKRRSSRR